MNQKFIFLLISLFLIVSVKSDESEPIPFQGDEEVNIQIPSISDEKFFLLKALTESKSPNFVKINVTPKTSPGPNIILSVFKKDSLTVREQLAQSYNGKTFTWLSKSQVTEDKTISVQCSEYPCSLEMVISPEETAELDMGELFSYYVSEKNINMKFTITTKEVGENSIINVWATGAEKIDTSIDGLKEYEKYSKNTAYVAKVSQSGQFTLTVTGTVGDYINVGSSIFNGGKIVNKVKVDQDTVSGFLKKGFVDENCYSFEMKEFEEGKTLFLTGVTETRLLEVVYKDMEGEIIDAAGEKFVAGTFSNLFTSDDLFNQLFCIRFPQDEDQKLDLEEMMFTFEVTSPIGTTKEGMNVLKPRLNGQFYPQYLKAGSQVGIIGLNSKKDFKEINYNLISINGESELLVYSCDTYPLCLNTEKIDESKIQHLMPTNKVSTWSENKNELGFELSPINPNQNIMVIKCKETSRTDDTTEEYCGFGTLIYTNSDRINLIEDQYFSQLLLKNEKDLFLVDYTGEKNINKIYIDVMVFSGEVTLNVENTDDNVYHRYYSANKIFLSITIDPTVTVRKIHFNILASKNSYYTIQSSLVRGGDDSWITNELPSGMSYLVTVDPAAVDKDGMLPMRKDVKFQNLRLVDEVPYFVNFYSMNCKFFVSTLKSTDQYEEEYKPIETVDYYSQDIVTSDDIMQYYSLSYDYRLEIEEIDYAKYNHKLCMIYASGIELEKDQKGIKREIVISENVPQQIFFKKGLNNIKYLYPLVERDNDAIVRFNIFDKAKYKVKVYFGKTDSGTDYEIVANNMIYLSHYEWEKICTDNSGICNIIIDVTMVESIEDDEPMLELAIKTIKDNTASYLQKNIMRYDYLHGKHVQHFYTDIGIEEYGYVSLNFHRGSGNIYGKIVSKEQTVPDKDADFRGMYKFPSNQEESTEIYESYNKKMFFSTDEKQCVNGCFLLITLESNIKGLSTDDTRAHAFTIFVHTGPVTRDYSPPISFPLDEYVIGNLVKSENEDNNINEFYTVWFPHDADKVIFDLQSDGASLYIRIGERSQPTRKTADFALESIGTDTLFAITKEQILQVAKDKKITLPQENSIKDLCLIIGVWTNVTDSVYTTVFSFKVHLAHQNDLDIFKINSDQKVLCRTQKITGSDGEKFPYRCLFVVEYEFIEAFNNLLLYPVFHDQSAFYQLYADYIDKEDYELWNQEILKSKIPHKGSTFSTDKTKLDYIYTPHGLIDKYLFVSVVTSTDTIVELLSTFYGTDEELSANPSSSQLFTIKTEKLVLDFPISDDFIVNMISLAGEAEVYWEDYPKNIYYLRGRDDKLSITSHAKGREKLVIKNLKPIPASDIGKEGDTDPGFALYMSHTVRSIKNIDELILGKSANFVYSNSDLPIVLYTRLNDVKKDLNIYFSFYELTNDKNKTETFIEEKPVEIHASIVKENTIYSIKNNPEIGIDLNKAKKGIYSAALKTGFISLSKEEIANYHMEDFERPYLYLIVSKTTSGEKLRTYTRISYEVTASQENSQIPSSEKIYQYGNLNINSAKSVYKLRTSLRKKFMRIEFAGNSGFLNWAVSRTEGQTKNDTFSDWTEKFVNGRSLVTFISEPEKNDVLYLTVFHREDKKDKKDNRLNNFVFKYINTDDVSLLKDYEVKNSEIKVSAIENEQTKDGIDYTIVIDPVPDHDKLFVTYLVKFVSQRSMLPDESYETIAITQSNELVKEFVNQKIEGGKIRLFVYDVKMNYEYIQVIAQISDKTVNEYLAYKGSLSPEVKGRSHTGRIILFAIIGTILILIIAALIVIIVMFNKKNKDLLKKVEKISFQQDSEQRPGEDGGLLLNDDQNALG